MSIRTAETSDYASSVSADDQAILSGTGGGESYSVIDRHSTFDGTYHSSRDVRIEGEVKGTIECQGTLFVAQGANVTAKVEAENITVAGDLNGDIRCLGRLQIMPSGRVRGKVSTQTLVINEGAYYEGQLEMASPESRVAGNAPRALPPVNPVASPVQIPSQQPSLPRQSNGGAAAEAPGGSKTFIRRFGGPETPWEGAPGEGDGGDTTPPPRED